MRIPRIYLPIPLNSDHSVELDEKSAHHIRSVLRLKAGNSVILFNGQGFEFTALLTVVSKSLVRLEIEEKRACDTESPLSVHFGLVISRGERMEFAIQKAVELGVHRINPLLSERCVVKLDSQKAAQKQSHWQRIATHASEQSGRACVPEVCAPTPLYRWLKDCRDLRILLDPRSTQSLSCLKTSKTIYLLSGPEGGFSEPERQLAIENGFIGVNLGPRILRTETAPLTAIALIQGLWGDLCGQGQNRAQPL